MKLYVVRHGQTDYNKNGKIQGRIDIPLNKIGIMQAEEASERLKNIKIDLVISSPLSRAYETAKIISGKLGVKTIILDDEIIERSYGDLEGKSPLKSLDFKDATNINKNYSKYNIESLQNVYMRVSSFLKKVYYSYNNRTVLVVTHCGVMQAIECYYKGAPNSGQLEEYSIKNAEVKIYEV